jgi:hypothetical protein
MWRTIGTKAPENQQKAFRVHRWVLWWFYVGVVCGIVAVSTILLRDLTRTQEHILIFLGITHWLLGGLVCWACEGIQMEKPMPPGDRQSAVDTQSESMDAKQEWHPASDFLIPGTGHTILPPSRAQESREMVEIYKLRQPERKPEA